MSATELPWEAIASGATFEWLVAVLVFFEDPEAKLFGRPGKDGGQDVLTGNGATVFQAKFHADRSPAKAIADAKGEAEKIKKYRAPADPRSALWTGVHGWTLATNAAFGPTHRKQWRDEVEPAFAALGIKADYWSKREIEARVIANSEVREAFFGGQTRVFLSLPEARERLLADEVFAPRTDLMTLQGRVDTLDEVDQFLVSDKHFLLLHGPGGIGKSRVLLDAGLKTAAETSRMVLWANVASMEDSTSWFKGVPAGRDVLLLVDEPEADDVLKVLAEQTSPQSAPMARWKVIVAVRSPKDPVVRFLDGPKMRNRVRKLSLAPLQGDAAKAFCVELIQTGPSGSKVNVQLAASELAKRFANHPIWMRLAVQVLELHSDLAQVPNTAEQLADVYLDEIIDAPGTDGRADRERLLQWVALFRTVNSESPDALRLLSERCGLAAPADAAAGLAALARRGALRTRGARNRLFELKPDVVRDRVLTRWLVVNVGVDEPKLIRSPAAEQLVQEVSSAALAGSMSPSQHAILAALGRTDFLLRIGGRPVEILAAILRRLQEEVPAMTATSRVFTGDLLSELAEVAPHGSVALATVLRSSPVEQEEVTSIFGRRVVGHDEVVLSLAWGVFHAAMGADTPALRTEVFHALCELVRAEAAVASRRPGGRLPNDGKRAAALAERAIEGGPNFWGTYGAAALEEGRALLAAVGKQAPDAGTQALLDVVVVPATAVERRVSWSDEDTIHIQNFVILPGDPAWEARAELVAIMRTLLESDATPLASRVALWAVLARAHGSANRAEDQVKGERRELIAAEVTRDLDWTLDLLRRRSCGLDELRAARAVWEWHARFEKQVSRRAIAKELEGIFESNELAREFEPLTSYERMEKSTATAKAKAKELVAAGPAAVAEFVGRAVVFLRGEEEFHRVLHVAAQVGHLGRSHPEVVAFAKSALAAATVTPMVQFSAIILQTWLRQLRSSAAAADVPDMVRTIASNCGSPAVATHLMWRLYGGTPPPLEYTKIRDEEIGDLRSRLGVFLEQGRGPAFVEAITWGLRYDWTGYRALVESTLSDIPAEHLRFAVGRLVDAVYWVVRYSKDEDSRPLPPNLGIWVLDQLLRSPDLDSDGSTHWHVEQILDVVGRPDVRWLAGAVRRTLVGADDDGRLPTHDRLSKFVVPVGVESAQDPAVRAAVDDMIALAETKHAIGYSLPKHLLDIDPEGLLVPELVAARIETGGGDQDRIWRLARLAGQMDDATAGWRSIARAALQAASRMPDQERRSIYFALGDHFPSAFSVRRGEVPEHFVAAAADARQQLDSEVEDIFKPLWQARLAAADAELKEWQDRALESKE